MAEDSDVDVDDDVIAPRTYIQFSPKTTTEHLYR